MSSFLFPKERGKFYLELTDEFDERRMRLVGIQLGIDKTRAEIEILNRGDDNKAEKDVAAIIRWLVDEINAKAD